jgi:alanine dehydrogenase
MVYPHTQRLCLYGSGHQQCADALSETAAEGGVDKLIWYKINIRSGIYLFKGSLTNFYLSERFDLKYTDLNLLIASRR